MLRGALPHTCTVGPPIAAPPSYTTSLAPRAVRAWAMTHRPRLSPNGATTVLGRTSCPYRDPLALARKETPSPPPCSPLKADQPLPVRTAPWPGRCRRAMANPHGELHLPPMPAGPLPAVCKHTNRSLVTPRPSPATSPAKAAGEVAGIRPAAPPHAPWTTLLALNSLRGCNCEPGA
jgi:hypothetical protein